MLYFKKSELAETYHISEKTVTNWIRESKEGKLDLELYEEHGRARIANTTRNITLIEQLIEDRKKFRNSRGVKEVSPKPEFYEMFNQQQIFDITSNLDIRHEIPFQYCYFDGGADYWDKYTERLASEERHNFLTSAIRQLRVNWEYIADLVANYQRVNVVDIGPGNVMPVKAFLERLLEEKKLGRYIALDISATMLAIAEHNVHEWFGDRVQFESHVVDINYDRFTPLLADDMVGGCAASTVTIVFALGGIIANLRTPDGAFKTIHDSMNRDDLLIYNLKLDTQAARQYFDFNVGRRDISLDTQTQMIIDLLNINESFYDVEMGYDPEVRQRYTRIRLKVALTINFNFENGVRSVEFHKNDTILLWRYWHQDVHEVIRQLDRTDFDVLQTSITEDKNYLLTVSRVKSEH
jgi:uncharacterized SAM-dependent methyltransferase